MRVLEYVGVKPRVSQKGVSFDQSQSDRYTFLSVAVEILESVDFNPRDNKSLKEKNGLGYVTLDMNSPQSTPLSV
ncbi:MAG: hypothetical protein L3J47_12620 [Sulfurovum sp.]|nr:hypothetical protein [Sulfurovum sp.]